MMAYKSVREGAYVQTVHRSSYLLDLLIRLMLRFSLGPIARVLEAALQSLSNGPVHVISTNNFELLSSLALM
jgi:hypothetical protein